MRIYILFIVFIFTISCKKEEKTFYPDGSIKTLAEVYNSKFHGSFKAYYENGKLEIEGNYENGLMNGICNYYTADGFIYTKILFKMDTAKYKWGYYKSGKIKDEGFVKDGERAGKWIYYEPMKDSIKEINEYFHIGEKKHLNQVWKINHIGDTIGGQYFSLSHTEPLSLSNQLVNFHLKHLAYLEGSKFYLCIPTEKSKKFEFDFSNENEVVLDTIKLDLKKDPIPIELEYRTPGKKSFRGFIIEQWYSPEPEVSDFNSATRKIYFDKEIYIENTVK